MLNRKFFFDSARSMLFDGKFTQGQVNGLSLILNEWELTSADKDDRWLAYMLATTHHETDRKMAPIDEYGKGKNRLYGQRIRLDGMAYADTNAIFYGRGFVQLTWYENYEKAGNMVGANLVTEPELALDPGIATKILFAGMESGWFTGRKLGDYFNPDRDDWVNARRIINGTDKAQLIASYGQAYYRCLSYTT